MKSINQAKFLWHRKMSTTAPGRAERLLRQRPRFLPTWRLPCGVWPSSTRPSKAHPHPCTPSSPKAEMTAPCRPYPPPPLGRSQHILNSPISLLYPHILHSGWKGEEDKPLPSWGSLETALGAHKENPMEAKEMRSLLWAATGQVNCGTPCFHGNQGGNRACQGPVSRFCFARGTSDLCSKLPGETDATALHFLLDLFQHTGSVVLFQVLKTRTVRM